MTAVLPGSVAFGLQGYGNAGGRCGTPFEVPRLLHWSYPTDARQVAVAAVAVNKQDTLLASADSLGRIVLWRRIEDDQEEGVQVPKRVR